MPGGGGGWAVLELTGTLPQVPVMLKRRLQTTQTMQTGSVFFFFKVNFDLLYFLELFTFGRVKMPWPTAWHRILKKIYAPGS